MKTFRALMIAMIALIAISIPVSAQNQGDAPDYRIIIGTNASQISQDGQDVVINVSILNNGGTATRSTIVELVSLSDGRILATYQLPALTADASETIVLRFPVDTYPPNSEQLFWIRVGIDDIEAANSSTVFDNQVPITVIIPNYSVDTVQPNSGGDNSQNQDAGSSQSTNTDSTNGDSTIITIPLIEMQIDTSNRQDMLLAAGILACGVVMLWIFLRIFRLLFRRYPAFGNMQPPYATVPPMDPNSPSGRRQLWQPHAQHNLVPARCTEGQIYARKVLLGMDGYHLSGWSVKSIRMTQYDMYGRVSRSEVLASAGDVRRLNRIAKRANYLERGKISKRVRPIAKNLAKRINKKIYKRSASLPIALDVRLQGTHGEVRIMFELYQGQYGYPHQIDNWEPEMVMSGRYMYESYTFTVNGQSGQETVKMFRKRLPFDVQEALTNMLLPSTVEQRQSVKTPSQAMRVVAPPDTLSSTQPVQANTADTAQRSQSSWAE